MRVTQRASGNNFRNFSTGSVPFRKAHLQFLIDVIDVDDHRIRIKGRKDRLSRPLLLAKQGKLEFTDAY